MNNVEVLVIKRLTQKYINYHEKSETIKYNGVIVQIEIDGLEAYIDIYYDGLYRERQYKFDPEKEIVESYR